MPSKMVWALGHGGLLKEGEERKCLKYCLIKIRECFVRANICYQSKSLHDTVNLLPGINYLTMRI
jgi:hypothetical protein